MVRAAKYLGVPPWELLDRPIAWREFALAAENAESKAQAKMQEKANKRRKT